MPVEKKKSLHHSRSDSDLIHPQVFKLRHFNDYEYDFNHKDDAGDDESSKFSSTRAWIPVVKKLRGKKSVAVSSSSSNENMKKYVLIFSTSGSYLLIRVVVDSLIPGREPPQIIQKIEKTNENVPCSYVPYTQFIGTTSPSLGPRLYLFGGLSKGVCEQPFLFDIHDPPSSRKCANLADSFGTSTLSVQVGECFYVLCFESGRLVFQKYDLEKNEWTIITGVPGDGKSCCYPCYPSRVSNEMKLVPHVVINRKLHVSLCGDSFAFDTEKGVWEDSNLFETFWCESVHSPSHFHGGFVCYMCQFCHQMPKTKKPFGFYGRGILLAKDLLLGLHSSLEYQLVAFMLDKEGRVVKSQPLSFTVPFCDSARLVDLNRDGYFGLVHVIYEPSNFKMELVTFKVSRPLSTRGGYFLECYIERRDVVANKLDNSVPGCFDAFCV